MVGIAAQAAVALDNARLYERVKRAAEERAERLEAERSARAEAERVNLMKDEFLATLSHELRTPLNASVGWSQVLRLQAQANPQVLEGLSVIDRNAKMQAQLIGGLLDMSRIISGKVRLDVQRVDVQEVVTARRLDAARAAALSAFARPEDRTRALRAGFQMHLSKPVEPTELVAAIASLAMRQQGREHDPE